MSIEYSSDCVFDDLEIRWEGGHHTMCGRIEDGGTCNFVAEEGPIVVNFRTDGSVTGLGFSLSYTVVEPGTQATCIDTPTGDDPSPPPFTTTSIPNELCGDVLNSQNGIITSPNHPNNYNHNTQCLWVINVTQPAVRWFIFLCFFYIGWCIVVLGTRCWYVLSENDLKKTKSWHKGHNDIKLLK